MGGEARCSICKETKSLDAFPFSKDSANGRMRRCRACIKVKNAAAYLKNKDKIIAQTRAWRLANPERVREINTRYAAKRDKDNVNKRTRKRYAETHPDKKRDIRLRSKYGITVEQYEEMWREQGGRCAICEREDRLVVDHNHETDAVRGLLCHPCNSALGMLRESRRACLNMVAYINRYSDEDSWP